MTRRVLMLTACLAATVACLAAAAPATPTFFGRRDYLGLNANWVQVADVNGDGIPDVIASSFGSTIETLLGSSNGTLTAGPSTATTVVAGSIVAASLTSGGTTDVILAGEEEGSTHQWGIGVCLGNGDGTFQADTFYPAGTDPSEGTGSAVVGDFNGDGIPDVVTAGASGVWLFTGTGNGTFNPAVLAVPLSADDASIAAADFNGDGNLDLVVTLITGAGEGFVVLLGNGNGTFQAPMMFSEPMRPLGLAVGPLTKGGPPGIALSPGGTDVYLYFGNGKGGFSGPQLASLPVAGIGGLTIGDVNGDGIPDLVSDSVYIAFGKGNGTFEKPVPYTIDSGGVAYHVVLADLRNDGLTDIVTTSPDAVSVLLSEGKGRYEDGERTPVTGGAGCGAAADYNGDGKPDLAVNTPTGITILLGTGEAGAPFTTGSTITTPGAPGCPVGGDLNGDGIPDLLVGVNGSPNAVLAYLGNGDGTFTLASTTPTPNSGGYIVLADFNNDGKLDFATSGNLLALGNGNGTFQTPVPFVTSPPSGGFAYIAAGDLNSDGWADVLLTGGLNNYIYELLNNQKGGFTQTVITPKLDTGAYVPAQIALADLGGKGGLDAIIASSYGGAAIYLNNGEGTLTYKETLTDPIIGIQYNPVAVADVNGDGIPDILMLEANTVGVFLGEGNATYAPQVGFGVGPAPNSFLVEDLHGQSASAGIPDIVAPDGFGGVTVLINETKRK